VPLASNIETVSRVQAKKRLKISCHNLSCREVSTLLIARPNVTMAKTLPPTQTLTANKCRIRAIAFIMQLINRSGTDYYVLV